MTYTIDNPKNTDDIPEDEGIRLGGDPGALLAAVPALLGFVPAESLILITLAAAPTAEEPGHPSQLGPVVRTDLHPDAVREAVELLVAAVADLPGGEVVAVHVGAWDATPRGLGRVTDLIATAEQILDSKSVPLTAVYAVPVLESAAPWRSLHPGTLGAVDWSPAGVRRGAGGTLPDPALSPAHATVPGGGAGPVQLPSQQEFHTLLDPVRPPGDLADLLVRHWRDGGPLAGIGTTTVTVQLAELLASLPVGTTPPEAATGTTALRDWLGGPGVVEVLLAACDRADVFPVLVAAGIGERGAGVRNLLAELARLARGSLRHRALVLFGLASLAGAGGVAGYRACDRVAGEIPVAQNRHRRDGHSGRGHDGAGEPDPLQENARERVTLRYAQAVLASVPGGAGDVVAGVLTQGLELAVVPDDERASLSVTERDALDAVVDRAAVSGVLRVLGRRGCR